MWRNPKNGSSLAIVISLCISLNIRNYTTLWLNFIMHYIVSHYWGKCSNQVDQHGFFYIALFRYFIHYIVSVITRKKKKIMICILEVGGTYEFVYCLLDSVVRKICKILQRTLYTQTFWSKKYLKETLKFYREILCTHTRLAPLICHFLTKLVGRERTGDEDTFKN